MLNLKLQTNAKDIPNLIRVDISGQDYYFTGDFAEIQTKCIQGQFQNFYPYKDFFTVNDIKAFDSSCVTSQDSPREIVDLIGFRNIEEVQFKQEEIVEQNSIELETLEEPENYELPSKKDKKK